MEWLERFNDAIEYIEDNLDGDIDYVQLAKITCSSTFHFNRMFSYIAGLPLSQYIRNRKMTKAAFDLQSTDIKIIDIALKYGYESPTAFNRAFRSVHDLAPSKARKKDTILNAFPPMAFSIQIKGDKKMEYKIISKEAFKIIGMKKQYKMDIEQNFSDVPKFWRKAALTGSIGKIAKLNNLEPEGVLGVSTCMDGENFDYYIAAASDMETPKKYSDYIIEANTWAVFDSVGPLPDTLQSLQKRIVTEWLPTSGYEYADAPDIEVYTKGNQKSKDYRCSVWIPIKKVY